MDTVKDAGKTQRYMFGYHPHAILPVGATWSRLMPEWAELFPGINPATMTAAIMHQMPILHTRLLLCRYPDRLLVKSI